MSTEWGIFNDESAENLADEAIEAGMYSREEAEKRLAEIRAEYADPTDADTDNLYVAECEEPEEEDDDEEDEDDEEEDDEVECNECGSLDTEYVRTCANCRIARCKDCGEETPY